MEDATLGTRTPETPRTSLQMVALRTREGLILNDELEDPLLLRRRRTNWRHAVLSRRKELRRCGFMTLSKATSDRESQSIGCNANRKIRSHYVHIISSLFTRRDVSIRRSEFFSPQSTPHPAQIVLHSLPGRLPSLVNSSRQVRYGRRFVGVTALLVRAYTTRKGDTVQTIAEKRGFSVEEIQKLNHSTDLGALHEGMTLLLPAEKLSDRDREIISGIGPRYRTYPVRKGETLTDILAKRNIPMDEFKALNTDIDTANIKPNMILKLPAGKYTTREKEMLMGALHVPSEFFQSRGFVASSTIVGVAVLVSLFVWWRSLFRKDE